MELQCKERVDVLEALRKSRKEAEKSKKRNGKSSSSSALQSGDVSSSERLDALSDNFARGKIGEGTVPALTANDLPPPLPQRPALIQRESLPTARSSSTPQLGSLASPPLPYTPPTLPVPPKKTSRTPSPDKKGGRVMLTTLRGPKDAKGRPTKATKLGSSRQNPPQASSKAAGLAWDGISRPSGQNLIPSTTADAHRRESLPSRTNSTGALIAESNSFNGTAESKSGTRTPPDLKSMYEPLGPRSFETAQKTHTKQVGRDSDPSRLHVVSEPVRREPSGAPKPKDLTELQSKPKAPVDYPSYRTEFPPTAPSSRATAEFNARIARRDESPNTTSLPSRQKSPQRKYKPALPNGITRRPVANSSSPRFPRHEEENEKSPTSESNEDTAGSGHDTLLKKAKARRKPSESTPVDPALAKEGEAPRSWEERVKWIRKHLPKGVDETAAKQIFNEIVVRGDEVHWGDVAGLDAAKTALKEAVVYPFLRPDLFMGLREPARGMLLFGPPGTGKTMLARAVATESRSTFFAISASSLTSKWLGESEKLVRALFLLAKALAPSIIFVDEIDSLLSSRGGSSEHETTRRIKTEFLIQWSDLQRAAAGSKQGENEQSEGDASRVLVLAATNMPWAIDEAARRRFVRRQYIPLPEAHVRAEQLRTLLGHQKHGLNRKDIQVLVELTDGRLLSFC